MHAFIFLTVQLLKYAATRFVRVCLIPVIFYHFVHSKVDFAGAAKAPGVILSGEEKTSNGRNGLGERIFSIEFVGICTSG